jgi:hypothetical protein
MLLQQLLLFYEPTNKITNDCLSNSYLSNKLNANEWINIRKANTDGYVDFDIPLIYKLLRNLRRIPPPTRGWEPWGGPVFTETTIGDFLDFEIQRPIHFSPYSTPILIFVLCL